MSKILIKNGRVIDPSQGIDEVTSILIEKGKVMKIAKNITAPKGGKVIDAKGKIVTPGWVDIHVHVREPGREDKETIATCSRAAAMGGVTTICSMPNVDPLADNQTVIEYIMSRAKTDSVVNIYPYGTITKGLEGKELTEMRDMQKAGMIGVSEDHRDVADLGLFKLALKYCKTFGIPVICHNENEHLSRDGLMFEGKISTYLGLPGVPPSAEATSVASQIILSEEVNYPVHFTHVSTASSVTAIREGKKRKLAITADCTPHHFSLTDEACLNYDTSAKVAPPLASEEHRKAVLKGLKDGTLDCIATDHAPHTLVEKYVDFQHAAKGISGIETLIPLCITNLVNEKILDLPQLIEKVTVNPAKVVKLNKGTLKVGADADVTIIDLNYKKVVDKTEFVSKGKNTPFEGMELKGWPTTTIVGGKIIVEDRKLVV